MAVLPTAYLGCGDGKEARLGSVVLITIDTLRSDHCSCYGYFRETTPNLDRLAAKGVRFETAYAPMPTTGPSHASLFTSLYPRVHGVVKNGYVLDGGFTTLAEVLKARGYETAAFVSSYALNRKFGLGRGFDLYEDDFSESKSSFHLKRWEGRDLKGEKFDRRADETTDKALAWLAERDGKGPFFLWVHYFDPHHPYDPPLEYLDLFAGDEAPGGGPGKAGGFDARAYDGEVRFSDHEMGRLLASLAGLCGDEAPLVVVTADHGEGLMDHGHLTHGRFVYEEAVRIPLVFSWPEKIPANKTRGDPVEIGDIMPTLFSLLGLDAARGPAQGRDLAPLLLGDPPVKANRPIFLERRRYTTPFYKGVHYRGNQFGLREGEWKYIKAGEEHTEELYHLAEDPGELHNLAAERPGKRAEMDRRLEAIRAGLEKLASAKEQRISEEDDARFEKIGYIK